MPLWRGYKQNVYAICSRCGLRQKLSEMKWQNGILICENSRCVDTAIVGSRDLNVARAVAVDRHEMQPDRKLVEPVERKLDQNSVLF